MLENHHMVVHGFLIKNKGGAYALGPAVAAAPLAVAHTAQVHVPHDADHDTPVAVALVHHVPQVSS